MFMVWKVGVAMLQLCFFSNGSEFRAKLWLDGFIVTLDLKSKVKLLLGFIIRKNNYTIITSSNPFSPA